MRLTLRALVAIAVIAWATPAFAADQLVLVLDWYVNPDHAPILVAQELGYFAEAGLDVDIIAPADANDAPKLVALGAADLSITYQPQLYLQVAEGLPVRRVGTLIDSPLNCLAVLADGPVRTIADLRGRKVGYSVAGFEDALLKAMLERNGLKLSDVELVNVNFAMVPALLTGEVAAVIGAYRNFELNQMALEGRPGRAFAVEDNGIPAYDELIFIARADRTGDPRIAKFLKAVERGAAYIAAEPDKAWTLFVKGRPELDDALNRRAWTDTIGHFAAHPAALDRPRYQRFAEFLAAQKLIPKALAVEDYAVEVR